MAAMMQREFVNELKRRGFQWQIDISFFGVPAVAVTILSVRGAKLTVKARSFEDVLAELCEDTATPLIVDRKEESKP